MNELIDELNALSKQWGCDDSKEIMNKYDGDIGVQIKEILKVYKHLYKAYDRDYVSNGDYYNCYTFVFISMDNKLYLTNVEIDDC